MHSDLLWLQLSLSAYSRHSPILFGVASLTLKQSYNCPSVNEVTLKDADPKFKDTLFVLFYSVVVRKWSGRWGILASWWFDIIYNTSNTEEYKQEMTISPKVFTWPNQTKHSTNVCIFHGPLTRYVKLQVAHAPGMPGMFSPAADFKVNR